MKILVPFDFTKSSEKALKFAMEHCGSLDQIDCIHTIGPIYIMPEMPVYIDRTDVLASSKSHLEEIGKKLSKSYAIADTQLHYYVQEGPVVATIFSRLDSEAYDLIVMGTHDKESLFDRLLGSNSNSVAALSDIPTILVHSASSDQKIHKILFAFDESPDLSNALKQFLKLNKSWNVPTDFVHIKTGEEDVYDQFDRILKKCYIEEEVKFPINVNVVKAKYAIEEIERMAIENKYDMIVLVKDNSGLFSGYFKPSFSINAVHKISIPVMILKEKI